MTINIKLKEINDVYKLVNVLVGFDGDVDLESGKYKVDGKSILGIFSLDLSLPITVEAYSDECDDLIARLKKFEA
jgi:phosphotransferase system HPr-like phosphotransfer protein